MSNETAVKFGVMAQECAALAAFVAEACRDHLGVLPDDVDWAWIGTVAELRADLVRLAAGLVGGGGAGSTADPAAAGIVADYFGESVAFGAEICEGAADDPETFGDDLVTAVFAKYGNAEIVR